MSLYLLDTNIVSHFLRGHAAVVKRMRREALTDLSISSLTEAELLYGLGKNPKAVRLAQAVEAFLRSVDILPWDSPAARSYAALRNQLEVQGKALSPLDTLIAAHTMAVNAILISNDQAFAPIKGLRWQDWTQ